VTAAPAPASTTAKAAGANSSAPDSKARPCEEIRSACEDAGFEFKKAKEGNGISADCIVPILKGTPQPANAKRALPQVDPQIVAACRKRNPNFGQAKSGTKAEDSSTGSSAPQ
jgi:hypothetical protein